MRRTGGLGAESPGKGKDFVGGGGEVMMLCFMVLYKFPHFFLMKYMFISATYVLLSKSILWWCFSHPDRWQAKTLENEYAYSKTVWPVAQTEALFLPEFPVGIEEKLKLIVSIYSSA